MKLVADEGVDLPIVTGLRVAGFEVVYFAELAPGSNDQAVLSHADSAASLLLTCDKDFGELVFRNGMTSAGVLLIRLHGLSAELKTTAVVNSIRVLRVRARHRI